MVVKTLIFDGQHGLHDALRDGRERDLPPLLPPSTDQLAQDGGIQRQTLAGFLAEQQSLDAVGSPGRWAPRARALRRGRPLKHDVNELALVLSSARHDGHFAGLDWNSPGRSARARSV